MKTLPLSKGYAAIVDDDDYERLLQYKWTAVVTGQNIIRVYGFRREQWDKKKRRWKKTIYLHREIMQPPKGTDVDHINHDTLDNRKQNMRFATRSQNLANNRRPKGKTGFRGVTLNMDGSKAPYKTQFQGKCIGMFYDKIEAAQAYDAAALKLYGEFAKLNFPT